MRISDWSSDVCSSDLWRLAKCEMTIHVESKATDDGRSIDMRVVGMPFHVAGHQTAHRGKELRRRSMCEQQRRIRERASQQRLLPQMERTLQQPASTRIRQSLPLQVFEDIQQILVSSLQVLPGEPLQIARHVGVGKIAGAAQILDEKVAQNGKAHV